MTPGWPDLVIGGIALFFAWRGFRNGLIAELAGPVAVIIAIVAAFNYSGWLDRDVTAVTHLGPGSAHAIGTLVFAVLVYAIVTLVASLLGRIAALPGIALINRAGGALIGAAKALLVAAVVLYVALFFPLTPDLRHDLHASPLVQGIVQPDAGIDAAADGFMPSFIQPWVEPLFARHHV